MQFPEVPILYFLSECLTPSCHRQGYTMHTKKHFRVRFKCPECDFVKHERFYLENKARKMGQQVRRIGETGRKGEQQMSITVPPLSSESSEEPSKTPDLPRMEPAPFSLIGTKDFTHF